MFHGILLAAIALLTGLVAPASIAFAQSQALVVAPPGTRFYTSGGNWHEIDSVDGSTVRSVANSLVVREWFGFCEWPGADTKFDRRAADALWPLSTGKSVVVEKERGERRWKTTLKVVGTEEIKVPAGTFSTWVIEGDEVGVTQKSRAVTRCWYTPEAGGIVKRRVEIKEGSGQSSGFEVIKIDRQDRSKVAAFRPPRPGTSFDTTRGGFRIDGSEGTTLFRKSDDPKFNTLWAGGIYDIQQNDPFAVKIASDLARLWPLEIGKKINFSHDRPAGGLLTYDIRVDRVETIKVPAGSYSAFVIKMQVQAVNGSLATGHTYWWSPALGFPVKHEAQFIRGSSVRQDHELRAAKPP